MNEKKILVTNIQRMSFHDGPGIRTTFFLKGCPLNCPWCANPENISFEQEEYIYDNKLNIYGQFYTINELYEIGIKDLLFYEKDGGITFSGGEPLVHFDKLESLLKMFKQKKIQMCVETSLYCSKEQLKIAMEYIDLFYVDIKILEKKRCLEFLGVNVDIYKKNLEYLCNSHCKVIFRIPIINGYTNTKENVSLIVNLLKEYSMYDVEILKQHSLGKAKYKTLKKHFLELEDIDDSSMEFLYKEISSVVKKNVTILKI